MQYNNTLLFITLMFESLKEKEVYKNKDKIVKKLKTMIKTI